MPARKLHTRTPPKSPPLKPCDAMSLLPYFELSAPLPVIDELAAYIDTKLTVEPPPPKSKFFKLSIQPRYKIRKLKRR